MNKVKAHLGGGLDTNNSTFSEFYQKCYNELVNKVLVIAGVLILGIGGFLVFKNQASNTSTKDASAPQIKEEPISASEFITPKKAAHFESNTPEHGSILAGVPVNVVIDFNFDLSNPSSIIILPYNKGREIGIDRGIGETIIDDNRLSMRRKMDPESTDDLYTVVYKACWADGSCHDGEFQFKIDRTLLEDFEDMTGKKEVTINLENYAFSSQKVKISKGTKVTWVNQDSVIHTINTDPHPGHSYYLGQNSRDLKKGESYSVSFTEPGIYPYHCSPHADNMKAILLVE